MSNSSREQAPFSTHRRYFGWASSTKPEDFYEEMGRPSAVDLPGRVFSHVFITEKGPTPKIQLGKDWMYMNQALDALRQGVRDVSVATYLGLASPDEALRAATREQQPTFIDILAQIATLPQEEVGTYFHVQGRRLEQGRLDLEAFTEPVVSIIQEDELDPSRGCPFAKPTETVSRSPIFDTFAKWATQLAMLSTQDPAADFIAAKDALMQRESLATRLF